MNKKFIAVGIVCLLAFANISFAENVSNFEQSNACLEQARKFHRIADITSTETNLNQAIKLNPNNYEAYYEFGVLETSRKNYDKAINYYSKAIKLNPQNDSYYVARAITYGFQSKLKEAIDDANKAIEINPKNGPAYSILAVNYGPFGFQKEAIAYYDKAEQYDNLLQDNLFIERANLKTQIKDYDGAINDYKKAINLLKQNKGNQNLAKIEFFNSQIKDLEQAKKIFK